MVVPRANDGLSSGGVNPAAGVTCPKVLPAPRMTATVARRVRSFMLHLPPCWRGDSWPTDMHSDAVVCKFRVKAGESLGGDRIRRTDGLRAARPRADPGRRS